MCYNAITSTRRQPITQQDHAQDEKHFIIAYTGGNLTTTVVLFAIIPVNFDIFTCGDTDGETRCCNHLFARRARHDDGRLFTYSMPHINLTVFQHREFLGVQCLPFVLSLQLPKKRALRLGAIADRCVAHLRPPCKHVDGHGENRDAIV